jgi:hypothetical protein
MGETPIYDSLVGELGDTLAEVRALFSQHIVDDVPSSGDSLDDTTTATDQPAAVAA